MKMISAALLLGMTAAIAQEASLRTPESVGAVHLSATDSIPVEFREAVRAASDYLSENGEDPANFYVGDLSRAGEHISLPLWHIDAFDPKWAGFTGNPGGKCRTLGYDPKAHKISSEQFWQ